MEGIKLFQQMIQKRNKIKIIFIVIGIFFILFLYANLKYSKGYNIIIENKTEQWINRISLIPKPRSNSKEKMDITTIAPNEKIKIIRNFCEHGESFIAEIDTPIEQNKVIPLSYIYSPNAVNIVYIIIDGAENGKITDLTIKSFDNSPSLLGWLRLFYDYNIVKYEKI